MTDRWLLACALVPMLGGIAMVALLQRPPAAPHSAAGRKDLVTKARRSCSAPVERPWIGVVVAATTAELAADADGHVAEVFVQNGARVAVGDKLLQFDEAESSSAVGIASAELGQRRSESARAQAERRSRPRPARAPARRRGVDRPARARQRGRRRRAWPMPSCARPGRREHGTRARSASSACAANARVLTAPFAGSVATLGRRSAGDSVVAGQVVLRILSDDRQVRFAFPPGELVERQVAITLARERERAVAGRGHRAAPGDRPLGAAGVCNRGLAGAAARRRALDPGRSGLGRRARSRAAGGGALADGRDAQAAVPQRSRRPPARARPSRRGAGNRSARDALGLSAGLRRRGCRDRVSLARAAQRVRERTGLRPAGRSHRAVCEPSPAS